MDNISFDMIKEIAKLYALNGYVEKHISEWIYHINSYKVLSKYYFLIKYEELVSNKSKVISSYHSFSWFSVF